MMSFAEDDRFAMTSSPATVDDHNATLAIGGGSAWRTGTLGLLAVLTSVVTVGGNLIVILSFVLERTIRQPSNYFIASLAVSDLLIGQSRFLVDHPSLRRPPTSAPYLGPVVVRLDSTVYHPSLSGRLSVSHCFVICRRILPPEFTAHAAKVT